MTPLGLEDEEEDMTMFEMPSQKSRPWQPEHKIAAHSRQTCLHKYSV
jgi:hypothetical protein